MPGSAGHLLGSDWTCKKKDLTPSTPLDEPTSAMDAKAEAEVFEHLQATARDQILILISHRFSTVRRADRIAVMDSGRITELGTHDELMALNGHYAHLFTLQAEAYR